MPARSWRGFRSVLCPIDFSETSKRALEYAAALAALADARLVAIYVADPLLVAAAETQLHDRRVVQRSRAELGQFVEAALAGVIARRRRVRLHVAVGDAAGEILKNAGALDAIVMGTRGATGARRLMLGSTTLEVLQRTPVPVFAIPPADRQHPFEPLSSGGVLVCALELDAQARRQVETAATIATWLRASLLLVHVVESIDAPSWMAGALSAHQRIRLAQAEQVVERLTAHVSRRVEADGRVVCGHPADELAAVVAATKSKLLMTTLSDRRGWFGSRRGSVSYHVLSHAVVPVLACPSHWQPR